MASAATDKVNSSELSGAPNRTNADLTLADNRCPYLLLICAFIAALGTLALGVGNIVATLIVPNHNPISETISDLAAGPYESIQDVALYGFAAALFACSIGASHFHSGQLRWTGGIFSLAMSAAVVTIIAARNEYGDNDTDGVEIHIYLVYALGLLFALITSLMAAGMRHIVPWCGFISIACFVVWVICAPLFFMLPTSIDGAWERGLGIIAVIWTLTFAYVTAVVRRRYLT